MTEAEWVKSDGTRQMLASLLRSKQRIRKLRLFAVACCRRVWNQIPTVEARQLLEAVELYLEKQRTWRDVIDLRKAADAAYGPYYNAWVAGRINTAPYAWAVHQAAGQTAKQIALAAECAKGRPYGNHLGFTGADPDQADLLRDIFGNPFRPVTFNPSWRTTDAVGLVRSMYDARDFAALPILADALEDAGCDSADVPAHCRGGGPHVRGCWVVDLVLGKN